MDIKLKDGDTAIVFSGGRVDVYLPTDPSENTVGQILAAGFASRLDCDRAWAEELLDWSSEYILSFSKEESVN